MNIKLYRLKLDDNSYMSGQSVQTTKNKWLALNMNKGVIQRNLELVDNKGVIETIEISTDNPCKVGGLSFGIGETYSLINEDGLILHQTKKYVYTLTLSNGHIEKHKNIDKDTIDYRTGKGFTQAIK